MQGAVYRLQQEMHTDEIYHWRYLVESEASTSKQWLGAMLPWSAESGE
jgi:hypothetical protein